MRLSTRQKRILNFCDRKERRLGDILKMLGQDVHPKRPRYYLSRTLGRLVLRGELVRVRRGVFKKPSWIKIGKPLVLKKPLVIKNPEAIGL